MAAEERWIRSQRVLAAGEVAPRAIRVVGGRVAAVESHEAVPAGAAVDDWGTHVVLPGVVDTHVHINEPGRTEWEGFVSATRAAALGGITTLVDMPLNSIPPTTTVEGLVAKLEAASGKLFVDVGFCGGVIPGNAQQLTPLAQMGVRAFKCFLSDSGVDEFPAATADVLRVAMPILATTGKALFVHAELPGPLLAAARTLGPSTEAELLRHARWLASRPHEAEDEAVSMMVELCRDTGARAHIVHLSSSFAVPLVKSAIESGLPFSAETCPHYLHFSAERIGDGQTQFKCAPPIREESNRERLWDALRQGFISTIVSDHSPCSPELKRLGKDFDAAWGGIASLGLGLSIAMTHAKAHRLSLVDIAERMCQRTSTLAGLEGRKGRIAVGYDADFAVFDDEARFVVDGSLLGFRHKLTPYEGNTLVGRTRATYLRGKLLCTDGKFVSDLPHGEPLLG